MSGPVSDLDGPPDATLDRPAAASELEVIDGRGAEVGGFGVSRVLPRGPRRRTVGAWCFVDLMGPGVVGDGRGLDVGPHPHIGLQTVTWLFDGAVLHRDSLGSEQVIRPGQLNLMTAGAGIAHSEETTGTFTGRLHGVQLWVAQPEATRHGESAFEHHADLPKIELGGGAAATVLVGTLMGATSPARRDTDHLGADLDLPAGRTVVALDRRFEHALVPVTGRVTAAGRSVSPGQLGYLGRDRDEVAIEADDATRVLMLGGVPFPEPLVMWWNYVARTHAEIVRAHRAWRDDDGRFGQVASPLDRIVIGDPPWDG